LLLNQPGRPHETAIGKIVDVPKNSLSSPRQAGGRC
jgi:hypothetical protein